MKLKVYDVHSGYFMEQCFGFCFLYFNRMDLDARCDWDFKAVCEELTIDTLHHIYYPI